MSEQIETVGESADTPVRDGAADSGPAESPAGSSSGRPAAGSAGTDLATLETEGEVAADYLEGLLDIADLDGDIDIDVENGRAVVNIVGGASRSLVGEQGQVLQALEELTRLAVQRATGNRSRLMLDIADFRAGRRRELTALAQQVAADVANGGEPVRLDVMNPFERKVVHDAVAGIAGVESSSEGEEPRRRVVVSPAR